MNILQIVPSLEAGGAERATVDVAEALVAAGHKAFVVSSGGGMVAELEKTGARHIILPVDSKNPLTLWQNGLRLKALIKEHGIDLVHVRSRAPAWSAFFAARAAKVPFVTTFHAAYKGNAPWKKFYNSIMARGDRVIAISSFIAVHISRNYGVREEKITVIPRGISFSAFSPQNIDAARKEKFRSDLALPEGVPLIILPGRLSPIKGQELALKALHRLADRPFICLIIGPDQGRTAYREKLLRLSEELGLTQKVKFVEKTDLLAAYALADLVLSPSQVPEGFGRVPVEAQAFGVPVVATALGATCETVMDGETGWLVPASKERDLAHAISVSLNLSPEERRVMGLRAMHHVRSRFDVKDMCAKTLQVYAACMGKA